MNVSFGDKLGLEDQHVNSNCPLFVPENYLAYSIQGNIIGRKDKNGPQGSGYQEGISYTLTTTGKHAVVYENHIQDSRIKQVSVSPTIHAKSGTGLEIRRLMPIECERLQGFPDNYTAIPWRGKKAKNCPDGPRYKAMGNSMAVPVMRWIGERIKMFEREKILLDAVRL